MVLKGRLIGRILLGLALALAGWAAVAVIAFFNFVAGMGCANTWALAALDVTPAVCLGALLWWLRTLHQRGKRG